MSLADNTQGPDPSLIEAFQSLASYLSSVDKIQDTPISSAKHSQSGKLQSAPSQVAQLESIFEDASPSYDDLSGVFILINVPENGEPGS